MDFSRLVFIAVWRPFAWERGIGEKGVRCIASVVPVVFQLEKTQTSFKAALKLPVAGTSVRPAQAW